MRDAVHRVGDAHAVPVDRGFFVQAVFHGNLQPLALPHPDLWARHGAVVGPDRCLRVLASDQRRATRSGDNRVTGWRSGAGWPQRLECRSEEHTSELQSLMRTSYAVFCLKKKKLSNTQKHRKIYETTATITHKNTHIQLKK